MVRGALHKWTTWRGDTRSTGLVDALLAMGLFVVLLACKRATPIGEQSSGDTGVLKTNWTLRAQHALQFDPPQIAARRGGGALVAAVIRGDVKLGKQKVAGADPDDRKRAGAGRLLVAEIADGGEVRRAAAVAESGIEVSDLVVDPHGRALLAGDFRGSARLAGRAWAGAGAYLLRLDANLHPEWACALQVRPAASARMPEFAGAQPVTLRHLSVAADGGIVASGGFQGGRLEHDHRPLTADDGLAGSFVLAVQADGSPRWHLVAPTPVAAAANGKSAGSPGGSFGIDAVVASGGGSAIVGASSAGASRLAGVETKQGGLLMLRLGPTGKLEWSRAFPATGSARLESVTLAADAHIHLLGTLQDGTVSFDDKVLAARPDPGSMFPGYFRTAFVARLRPDGSPVWASVIGVVPDGRMGFGVDRAGRTFVSGELSLLGEGTAGGGALVPEKERRRTLVSGVGFVAEYDGAGKHHASKSFYSRGAGRITDLALVDGQRLMAVGALGGEGELPTKVQQLRDLMVLGLGP